MPQWYCIPPINYLESMLDWPTHMVIAPHLKNSETYNQFYVDNPHLYTLLDNGLWEGNVVSNDQLLTMANNIHANEIIAPDHESGVITITRTRKFIEYITELGQRHDFVIHGVVHGKKFHKILQCLNKLIELKVDVIDLPKMLGWKRRQDIMTVAYDRLKTETGTIPIHFLGYYKEELPLLEQSTVRSFDTSVPFKPSYEEKFDLHLPKTFYNDLLINHRVKRWKRLYH